MENDICVDVAIVAGGIIGITAAILMFDRNDIPQLYPVETARDRLNELIDTIFQTAPNFQLFVASIPPIWQPTFNQRVYRIQSKEPVVSQSKTTRR